MKSRISTLHCDADDTLGCVEWSVDYWAESVSSVAVTRVTPTERAPGWTTNDKGEDFCPKHSRERMSA